MNEGGEQQAQPSEPKRILMVDDDITLLRIVREALTSCLRCEVDTSPKPDYAFELALKKNYDLFLFDFQMPIIDGATLFFLIGKVYNAAQPARDVPPLLLISGKRMKSAPGIIKRTRRGRAHRQTISDEPAAGQGEAMRAGLESLEM